MPFDSEGHFTRIHSWEDDRINDIEIVSESHDEEDNNFADGLSQTVLRDGRVAMTGNLNMAQFQVRNVKEATNATDAVNKGQSESIAQEIANSTVSGTVFVGDIKQSLQTANHGNWLLCNGQAVSRTDYADLFAVIGTNFGSGDGATTFNVPDYRGKFLRGLGGNSAADFQTTQSEGLPNISGSFAGLNTGGDGAFSRGSGTTCDTSTSVYGGSYVNFNASRSSAIYGASEHVTPINQAVNYFIKAKKESEVS